MARPKKQAQNLKGNIISLRISKKEMEILKAKQIPTRLPLSTFILDAALGKKITIPMSPIEIKAMNILAGIGNNLNQIAKLAHQNNLPTKELEEGIELVQQFKYKIMRMKPPKSE